MRFGRYADAWNLNGFGLPDEPLRHVMRRLEDALDAEGRDPATVERTIGVTVRQPDAPLDPDDEPASRASIQQLSAMLEEYAELGVDHLILEIGPKTTASIAWLADALERLRR